MGSIIAWLIANKGMSEKNARLLAHAGLVLLVVLALAGIVLWIRHDAVADDHAKLEKRSVPATDKAAGERANDAIAGARHEQEMHDAVHSVPDAAPAGPSHALACKRLHDRGRNPPACR